METIFSALAILGIVWGGMIFFLIKAIKFEKLKNVEKE